MFLKKSPDVYEWKSLKILEKKDQRWVTSDAASKRIWELFSEIILTSENLAETNKTDQSSGGLAENLLSKTNIMCLISLRDIVPIVSELCRKLLYSTSEDLKIEYFDDVYAKCLFDLDTLI